MKLSERIRAIVNHTGLSIPKYAQAIGVQTPQAIRDLISGKTRSLSDSVQSKILSYSPEINPSWLFTGEGEMLNSHMNEVEDLTDKEYQDLKNDIANNRVTLVPLINIDSVGGVYSPNRLTNSEQYIERMIPFPDARPGDVAILQSGNSMAPTIPAGAILQIRRVDGWREYFGYGGDFVLWLEDDRRITKQVLKYAPDPQNYVTCHSYNPEAADEELPKSMIKEVWKVVNVLINKGW